MFKQPSERCHGGNRATSTPKSDQITLRSHQKYYMTHSMKNVAFRSLFRWNMIILPILTSKLVDPIYEWDIKDRPEKIWN